MNQSFSQGNRMNLCLYIKPKEFLEKKDEVTQIPDLGI